MQVEWKPYPSLNCVWDGGVFTKDDDCIILHWVDGPPSFQKMVHGTIVHDPKNKDCLQNWARARGQEDQVNERFFQELAKWASSQRKGR